MFTLWKERKTGHENVIYEKITSRRTIRKYAQKPVPKEILVKCVDAARLSPSGANRQPLKYIIVNEHELTKQVFTTLKWAGYLPNYQPNENETPQAYIIITLDKNISENVGHDAGIVAMSISMVAHDHGLGTCIFGSANREKLKEILKMPGNSDIILAIAVGYPSENPVVDNVVDGNIKYWVDQKRRLHVPKRSLEEILKWNTYEPHAKN